MKKRWAAATLMMIVLAGCSSNAAEGKESVDGETIYGNKCSACHGGNLQGAVGPSVKNLRSKYSEAELVKIITDGTDRMPGHLTTDKESEIVAKWLMEK